LGRLWDALLTYPGDGDRLALPTRPGYLRDLEPDDDHQGDGGHGGASKIADDDHQGPGAIVVRANAADPMDGLKGEPEK